ncbi:MAG: hypothetical protein Q8787_02295 [Sweet potato little leaf phytoplasma]|nr:hypothetical protein [Sweet potato little leaf phytoplasma]
MTGTVGAGVGRHFALFLSDAEKERRRFDDVVELGITVEVYRRGCALDNSWKALLGCNEPDVMWLSTIEEGTTWSRFFAAVPHHRH